MHIRCAMIAVRLFVFQRKIKGDFSLACSDVSTLKLTRYHLLVRLHVFYVLIMHVIPVLALAQPWG